MLQDKHKHMLQKHAQELAKLSQEKQLLDEAITALKADILAEMKAEDITSYKSDVGTISFVTRRSYQYSDAVKEMEQEIKLKKVEEEETGVAQVKVTEFVQMNLPKQ